MSLLLCGLSDLVVNVSFKKMSIRRERMVVSSRTLRSSALRFPHAFASRWAFLQAQLNFALTLLNNQGGKMATKKRSSSKKKSSGRKYGKAAGKSVKSAMHRRKKGTLKSGKGGKGGTVKSRKQAIAIGLSEAREKGAKVPKKK
jgi:hypothetical protein